MDRRRSMWMMAGLVAASAVLAGACGGSEDGGSSEPTGVKRVEPSANGAQVEAMLEVTIENAGSKSGAGLPIPSGISCTRSIPATCTDTVECPVDAAEDPARAEVCRWLADEGGELLVAEPPADEVCTEIYGGPELATVTGTLDGADVDASFSRNNGCAISRYDEISPLWTRELDSEGEPDLPTDAPPSLPDEVEDPPSAFE